MKIINDFYCLDCEKYFTQVKKGGDMECVFCGSRNVDELRQEMEKSIFDLMEELKVAIDKFDESVRKVVGNEKRRDMERRPN
jgi:DNA-directed RNA polymerase subunit RPC12/RpoP